MQQTKMNVNQPHQIDAPAAVGWRLFTTLGNQPLTFRRVLAHLAIGVAINTVCAIVVTYLMRLGEGFAQNWVFSMCIGTVAMLLVDVARFALWKNTKPDKIRLIAVIAVSIPLAYVVGSYIAIQLLHLPAERVFDHQVDHATGLIILMVLVSLIVSWFYWSRAELSAIKAQAEADKAHAAAVEKQAIQAQLQLLQAQIEPHMLFNTLANVQGLIDVDAARASHMLDHLILYLRASLSSSRADRTELKHEFELMRAYLELMTVRMGNRLSYALHLPESLQHFSLPPMLLQPLLENAIKHGLESKIEGGMVTVHAEQHGEELKLSVRDTGLGLEATSGEQYPQRGTGLGLANVRERLRALYGDRASFTLQPNIPTGVIAELTLPTDHAKSPSNRR